MRILYLHPKAWIGEYTMLGELCSLGHGVFALEEKRDLDQGARWLSSYYRSPEDGITTLWYDPRRGLEKILTWPFDRIFRRAFEGRNLVHRMWVIASAVRRFSPDVIVCSDGFSYAIPAAFLKRLGLMRTRLVVSYIGGDILDCHQYGYGKHRTPMISWLIRTSLPGIDSMRALCDSLARVLIREEADISRINILPIQLMMPEARVEALFANRAQLRHSVRQPLGIPHDAPVIITLSGNHKGKGLQDLAAAWGYIVKAVPGCRWLLCGPANSWLEQGVWPVLRSQGLEETVHFTGTLHGDEVYAHMAAADLQVNPTLCEGLNMATVDAAAMGTPSVTSDAAGIADWVSAKQAGLVVPAGDVSALRDAVIAALKDESLRLTWQERSRTMAGDFYPDKIAVGLLKLLQVQPAS